MGRKGEETDTRAMSCWTSRGADEEKGERTVGAVGDDDESNDDDKKPTNNKKV